MKTLIWRFLLLSVLIVVLCVHLGLIVWTLIRFSHIEHWSPGIRFDGNEITQTSALVNSSISNLWEGSWPHLVQVRKEGVVTVGHVDAGSPAEQVGLNPGDRIATINGIEINSNPNAYFQTRLQSKPGDSINLIWLRDGQTHTGSLELKEQTLTRYDIEVNGQELEMGIEAMVWFQRGPFLIFPLVLLCLGTWMGFRSRYNKIAFQCALLFLITALSVSPAFHPMIAGWPDWVLTLSIFTVTTSFFLETLLVFIILSVFPVVTAFGTWMRRHAVVLFTPLFAWTSCSLVNHLDKTYGWDSQTVRMISSIVEAVPVPIPVILVVIIAGSLLFTQQSVARRQQRKRLHILEVGLVSTLVLAPLWAIIQPGTLLASWNLVPVQGAALPVIVWLLDRIVHTGLQCVLPLSFVYAIVAHRVFGLRFVFGRVLRYLVDALGVYLLLGLVMVFVLYEYISSWQEGVETSDLILVCALAGLLLILIGGWTWIKAPVMRFLDRHLFKNEFENRQRLFRFVRTLTRFRDRDALLSNTGKKLLEGLNLSYIGVYYRKEENDPLSVLWYDVNEGPGLSIEKDLGFFTRATPKIEETLGILAPGLTVVEYDDQATTPGYMVEAGFDLIVVIRGESSVRGCIAMGAKLTEEPFSIEEKEQLLVLAAELELALTNIEMAISLSRQADGMKRLSRRLIDIQESERRRLAQDLHDDTGQALTALKISLALTRSELAGVSKHTEEQLNDAVELTDDTLKKLRSIAHGLRPPSLDTVGLNAALEELCRSFAHHTRVSVDYNGVESPESSKAVDICLYRVLQEGLTNSVKHGQSTQIKVDLKVESEGIKLSIIDNGKGFDSNTAFTYSDDSGIGLLDMRERLESFDGNLEVASQPGDGTRLTASVPLEMT